MQVAQAETRSRRLVVSVEGADGSGKTTLLGQVLPKLTAHGIDAVVIGKRDTEVIERLTMLLVDPRFELDPVADAAIRVARDVERVRLAPEATLVLLDRGLLHTISMAVAHGVDPDAVAPLLERFTARDRLATVLCAPEFDEAWRRMEARTAATGEPLSRKEARGAEANRDIARHLEAAFERGEHTGDRLRLDTGRLDPEGAADQAASFLVGLVSGSAR